MDRCVMTNSGIGSREKTRAGVHVLLLCYVLKMILSIEKYTFFGPSMKFLAIFRFDNWTIMVHLYLSTITPRNLIFLGPHVVNPPSDNTIISLSAK